MSLSEKLEAARVALGKRKGREPFSQAPQVPAKGAEPWKPVSAKAAEPGKKAAPARDGTKLLAGSLAHEFLTHGTILGRRIEPSHAPAAAPRADEPDPKRRRRYAEVSWLLMAGGAHVPGVVNPTQLGSWLRIED